MRTNGSARTGGVTPAMYVAGFGRGAVHFLALPINLERTGIKKAAVFPEPKESQLDTTQRQQRYEIPVWAQATMSCPLKTAGKQYCWMGVGTS